MSTIQTGSQGIDLQAIKYFALQTGQKFSYFTKVENKLDIYVLKGMDKVKLFFEKMLNILTFGFAFSSENSLLGRIRLAKNFLLKDPNALAYAQNVLSLSRSHDQQQLVFDPFKENNIPREVATPELAIALLGYAVEQQLYDPKTERLVISKTDKGYILEKVSEDHQKYTDLKEFEEADLRKNATEIRDAAKKDHDSNFHIGTITFGIDYLFGEQVEEDSSDSTFFEEIDPNILPSLEDLLSDQQSAKSTRGNSPIGRHSADDLPPQDLEQLREDLTVQLANLQSNPYSCPKLIDMTQKRLLNVFEQQIKQV